MTVLVATDIGLFCMASFQELDLVVGVELVDVGFDESAWTLATLCCCEKIGERREVRAAL